MALLARGHQPEKGPYGAQIARAIDYVLSIQDPQVGSIFPERFVNGRAPYSFSGNYNHGISALMLAEVYGMTNANRRERIRGVITKASNTPVRSNCDQSAIRMTGEDGVTSTTLAPTIPICRSRPGR